MSLLEPSMKILKDIDICIKTDLSISSTSKFLKESCIVLTDVSFLQQNS